MNSVSLKCLYTSTRVHGIISPQCGNLRKQFQKYLKRYGSISEDLIYFEMCLCKVVNCVFSSEVSLRCTLMTGIHSNCSHFFSWQIYGFIET